MRTACIALSAMMFLPGGAHAWGDGFPTVEQLAGRLARPDKPPGAAGIAGRLWFQGYRSTLSRARGPACNFEPSCSRYAEQAIAGFGLLKGLAMAGDRLQRCNQCLDPRHYPRGRVVTDDEPRLHDPPADNDVWWLFSGARRPPDRPWKEGLLHDLRF